MRSADDLAMRCVENINFHTQHKWPVEDAAILITTPKGWKAPPKFPRSEIVSVHPETGHRPSHPRDAAARIPHGHNLTTIKDRDEK